MVSSFWRVMDARMNTTSKCASLQDMKKAGTHVSKMFNDSDLFFFFHSPQTKSCFCPAEREDSDENLKFHGAVTAKIDLIIVTLNFGITSPI